MADDKAEKKTIKSLIIVPPHSILREVVPAPSDHLGALYLAGYLREFDCECKVLMAEDWTNIKPKQLVFMKSMFKGWQKYKKYVTGELYHPIWDIIKRIVEDYKPDVVGINCPTPAIHSALRVSGIVKTIDDGILTVFGGPHATLLPEDLLKRESVDLVVRGEGEIPFLNIVRMLKSNRTDWESVEGLSYTTKGQFVHNTTPELIPKLDDLPFPARDLLISPENYKRQDTAMITSRGCPYNCSFCADHALWQRNRSRSVGNVIKELELLSKQYPHINKVYFIDGTLTFSKKFIFELCDAILNAGIKHEYYCTARFDNITEELLAKMKNAGFKGLYLGAESGDPLVLADMNKKITPELIMEKAAIVKKSGMLSLVSILVGVPGETEDSLKKTIALMRKLPAASFDINNFVPLPGCKWYNELPKEVTDKMNWLDFNYKGGHPYMFQIEGNDHLNKYIDKIYSIADRRTLSTVIKTIFCR